MVTPRTVTQHAYATYGHVGYAKFGYATWLHRLRHGYAKFSYATWLRHVRLRRLRQAWLRHIVTPYVVTPVTPQLRQIRLRHMVTPVTPRLRLGYAKFGYAT